MTEQSFIISNVSIIDVNKGTTTSPCNVYIEGEKVSRIEAQSDSELGNAVVIDGTDKFLCPGLFDCHVHVAFNGFLNTKNDYVKNLKQYLVNGVTTIVDFFTAGGDFPGSSAETIRDDVNSGKVLGPVFLTSYGCMNAPGGFCDCSVGDAASSVLTRDDVDREMDRLDAIKPDFIKIVYDDVFGSIPNLTSEILGELIKDAHDRGYRVACHIATNEQAQEAVSQGADILGHGIVDEIPEGFLKEMADKGLIVIPTLASYESWSLPRAMLSLPVNSPSESVQEYISHEASIYERNGQLDLYRNAHAQAIKNLKPMYDAGIKVVAGSDAGTWYTFPGEGLKRELEIYQENGITPAQALQMATICAAEAFFLDHELGSVEAGKIANLILLSKNPLESASNLRAIEDVFLKGQRLDLNQLKADLAKPSEIVAHLMNPDEEYCSPHHLRHASPKRSDTAADGAVKLS